MKNNCKDRHTDWAQDRRCLFQTIVDEQHRYLDRLQGRIAFYTGLLITLIGACLYQFLRTPGEYYSHILLAIGGGVVAAFAALAERGIRRTYRLFTECISTRAKLEHDLGFDQSRDDGKDSDLGSWLSSEQYVANRHLRNRLRQDGTPYGSATEYEEAMQKSSASIKGITGSMFTVAMYVGILLCVSGIGMTVAKLELSAIRMQLAAGDMLLLVSALLLISYFSANTRRRLVTAIVLVPCALVLAALLFPRVDSFAAVWGTHSTWKLAVAALIFSLYMPVVLTVIRRMEAPSKKWPSYAGAVLVWGACIGMVLATWPRRLTGSLPNWTTLHPSLAVHFLYANATYCGLLIVGASAYQWGGRIVKAVDSLLGSRRPMMVAAIALVAAGIIIRLLPG